MTEPGTFYGIGVGPGNPDLLTIKAARLITEVPVLAVPTARQEGESYALDIVTGLVQPGQSVLKLHFPMLRDVTARVQKRQEAARQVLEQLNAGRDVAFLTEGDPLLHSTFAYLLEHLPSGCPVEIIPGVSSVMAAAADACEPLVMGDERLAVLPAAFEDSTELEPILAAFDTVVLMKVYKVLSEVLDLLERLGIAEQALVVERASHPAGRVLRDVRALRTEPLHYLSLMIIYCRRLARES